MTMSRLRLISGTLLLVLGMAAVVMSARVLSTFLLEIVVATLDADTSLEIPPCDFSWGTMVWGNMTRDFSTVAVGLVMIGIGQSLVVPAAILRGESALQRGALIGAAVMTLVAAGSYFFVPRSTIQAFGMLAETGAADPVFMGEQMAVGANRMFVGCLVVAQLLIIVAAVVAGRPDEDARSARPLGKLLLVRVGSSCAVLFGLSIVFVRLVPLRMMTEFLGPAMTAADPAELARLIQQALRTMLLAAPLLAASGILWLIATLLPDRRGGSV
jgi:hypothetical protein